MNNRLKKEIPIIIFYIFLTLIQFHTLLPKINRAHLGGGIDARYFLWESEYSYQSLISLNNNFLDAPVLYPNKKTFLLAESQISGVIEYIFFRLFIHNPLVAFNILHMFHFFISIYIFFLFIRYLYKSDSTAIISSIVFGFSPFREHIHSHIYKMNMVWMILAIWFMILLFKNPKKKYSVLLAVSFIFNTLSCWYYAVAGAVILAVEFIYLSVTDKLRYDIIIKIIISALISILFLLPVVYSTTSLLSSKNNSERSLKTLQNQSLKLDNFIKPQSGSLLYKHHRRSTFEFFPGFVVLILAGIGLIKNRFLRIYSLILIILTLYITVGMNYPWSGLEWLLKNFRPLFQPLLYLRAIHVLIIGGFIGLTILTANGWLNIFEYIKNYKKSGFVVLTILSCCIILENLNLNIPIKEEPNLFNTLAVYTKLYNLKDNSAVIEIPSRRKYNPEKNWTGEYYINNLLHKHPILNGWASFTPYINYWIIRRFDFLNDYAKASLMKACGSKYAVLHKDKTNIRLNKPFNNIFEDTSYILYELKSDFNVKPFITINVPDKISYGTDIPLRIIFKNKNKSIWSTVLGDNPEFIEIQYTLSAKDKNFCGTIKKSGFFIIPPEETSYLQTYISEKLPVNVYNLNIEINFHNFNLTLNKNIEIQYKINIPKKYKINGYIRPDNNKNYFFHLNIEPFSGGLVYLNKLILRSHSGKDLNLKFNNFVTYKGYPYIYDAVIQLPKTFKPKPKLMLLLDTGNKLYAAEKNFPVLKYADKYAVSTEYGLPVKADIRIIKDKVLYKNNTLSGILNISNSGKSRIRSNRWDLIQNSKRILLPGTAGISLHYKNQKKSIVCLPEDLYPGQTVNIPFTIFGNLNINRKNIFSVQNIKTGIVYPAVTENKSKNMVFIER